MFDDEERIITAARRWASSWSDQIDAAEKELLLAVAAFERGRRLRPLKPKNQRTEAPQKPEEGT